MTVRALDASFTRAKATLRARTAAVARAQYAALGSWWGPDEEAFVRAFVPIVRGAQQSTATLTAAWLKARIATETGRSVPATIDLAGIAAGLRGVDPTDLYRRPFVQTRYAWTAGAAVPDAVESGQARLLSLVTTDLQLAHTTTAQQVLGNLPDGIVDGYARQTTGLKPCDLCRTASTWYYRRGDLLPIHDKCSCIVVPAAIPERRGAGLDRLAEANRVKSDRLMAELEAEGAPVPVVRQHGELGPVLAVEGQHFKGVA